MLDQAVSAELDQGHQAEGHEPVQGGETMQEMLDQYMDSTGGSLHKGSTRTGTVVEEMENGWLVDVGFKCEGFLPAKEWTHRVLVEDQAKPQKGDEVEVTVISIRDGEEAQLLLSRWRQEFDRRWAKFEEMSAQNETLQVTGLRKVKGGIIVDCCGLEGFMPVSHLTGNGRGGDLDQFIGRTFDAKPLERDRRKHRIVFSRKDLIAKEDAERRTRFYESVHEGDVLEGEVSSITDFGIFVTIGEERMDGLVHVSEITWKRNVRIRDLYKKGDKVMVKVIGIAKKGEEDADEAGEQQEKAPRKKDRISLSIKQVQGDPWLTVSERIHKDDVMKGTITNLTDFGAFVELEPGIEGLIHIGDISWLHIQKPKDVFRKGQEVEVLVLSVVEDPSPSKRRISLGYKQLHDPWKGIGERYVAGQDVQVKVVRLADFGAFVQVEEGVEALIHISQLSTSRVEKPGDVLHEGQEVTARVLEVSPEQRRMRLSISALETPQQSSPRRHDRDDDQSRDRRPKPREDRRPRHDTSVDDADIRFNPFAEAFKEQGFGD